MNRTGLLLVSSLALAAAVPTASAAAPAPIGPLDPDLLAGMAARAIGPATMSGRIAAVEAVPSDPSIVYVGAATSGVWKSVDGGLTWEAIFEDQPVASIGAIAVHPANPDLVWVGTGEGNPRNSVSVGNGVYRSRDAGRKWTHLGLDETERIHRILLDPHDPRTAFVCALGKTWAENPERGVFRTTDGGKSWSKVLYVDERTGCADLVADPGNPNKLFAAMWDHRRWPWFFRSGGPGSGLHVTRDGGDTWERLTPEDGLPEGDLGRIGLAIAPSDPAIVYALVEAEGDDNLFLRSADGGRTWKTMAESSAEDIGNRPFYYADLRVDPGNPNRVYSLWSLVSVTDDGGESWETLVPFAAVHPDHHAMWIDPADPAHIIEGNDGGVYISHDRGESWRFVANLPFAQYYHVRVDDELPYNVYGGLQDNGSWKGPSAVWENGGIRNHHWQEVGFGDGFDTVPDPRDPMQGYAMSQEGYLLRWNLATGERKAVRPAPPPDEELRFNWNAAIAIDPFAPDTIYYGSQFVHRSTDRGDSWTVISPDLTTDRAEWQRQAESGGLTPDVTGAENFTTLVAIAPSPLEKGVLWVGTDDGRLHLTRDGGETWTSVEENVQGVPAHTWIPHITPSPHDAATAFAVFDNHRRSDWTPYVQKTTDYGRTWTSLATDDLRGYALSIAQDPVDPELLYLGTEFGLWVSLDGGKEWFQWTAGVPTISVMDLAFQGRENDLVLATHGRGIFILDDVAPLRTLSAATLAEPLHLYGATPAIQHLVAQTGSSRFPGHGEFRGANEAYGAKITFSANLPGLPHPEEEKERERKAAERAAEREERRRVEAEPGAPVSEEERPGEVARAAAAATPPPAGEEEEEKEKEDEKEKPRAEIVITDAGGEVVRTFEHPVTLGVNRAVWDLRSDPFKEPPREDEEEDEDERGGPQVMPGTYRVTVKLRGEEASGTIEIHPDPRLEIGEAARRENWEALQRTGALNDALVEAIERLHETRSDIAAILTKTEPEEESDGGEGSGGREAPAAGSATAASASAGGEEAEEPMDPARELRRAAEELQEGLEELERRLWNPPQTKGIVAEEDALSHVQRAQWFLSSSFEAPTQAHQGYLREAEDATAEALAAFNRFYAEEVAAFRARVRAAEILLLPEWEPIAVPDGASP